MTHYKMTLPPTEHNRWRCSALRYSWEWCVELFAPVNLIAVLTIAHQDQSGITGTGGHATPATLPVQATLLDLRKSPWQPVPHIA